MGLTMKMLIFLTLFVVLSSSQTVQEYWSGSIAHNYDNKVVINLGGLVKELAAALKEEKGGRKSQNLAVAGVCEDQHEYCASWAKSGECEINPDYMLVKCSKSCKTCVCEDQHEYCASWAKSGECKINPDYMLVKCSKSCRTC